MNEMQFPNTVEEFMEQYKIVDTEQIYTNGAELVPIFRMKQWFEYTEALLSAQPIDVQEAYYRGKTDGVKECTARLKKVNEEFANG